MVVLQPPRVNGEQATGSAREHSVTDYVQLRMVKMNHELLSNVRIASPCNARWEDMNGDERSRFCRHCSKHVYNFSAMTAEAAADLIREREGNLCGRFYQRADGTMLTTDCPVGVERSVHWFKQLVSAVAACFCLSGSSTLGSEKPRPSTVAQRALMGDVCVQPVTTNHIKLGEISVQPPATNVVKQTGPSTNAPALLGKICVQPARGNPSANPGPTNPKSGSATER